MKTQRFSYFADFAARERMREAKPVKLKKVAFSHFFDTLRTAEPSFLYAVSYSSFFVCLYTSPEPRVMTTSPGAAWASSHLRISSNVPR